MGWSPLCNPYTLFVVKKNKQTNKIEFSCSTSNCLFSSPIYKNVNLSISKGHYFRPCWMLILKSCVKHGHLKRATLNILCSCKQDPRCSSLLLSFQTQIYTVKPAWACGKETKGRRLTLLVLLEATFFLPQPLPSHRS